MMTKSDDGPGPGPVMTTCPECGREVDVQEMRRGECRGCYRTGGDADADEDDQPNPAAGP